MSAFLLRPAPLDGESLSSWRQRAGWANGYRIFPVPDGRLRRVDPDLGAGDIDAGWLARSHLQTVERVRSLTYASLVGQLGSSTKPREHPPWLIPARYGKAVTDHGAMFCPHCLAQDAEPYFRLSWRLAFNYACPTHEVLLVDTCATCDARPWPAGCGVPEHLSFRFTSLSMCWRCGCDLRLARTSPFRAPAEPARWLRGDRAECGPSGCSTIELFGCLRAICQAFLRHKSRRLLMKIEGAVGDVAGLIDEVASDARCAEHLAVRIRRDLMAVGIELMKSWPANLETTALRTGISRVHFSSATHLGPEWFNRWVCTALSRQNRGVGEAEIRAAIAEIRQSGCRPTKVAVRKLLCWQGEIPNELLN